MMIRIYFVVSTDRTISGRCIVFSMFPCPLLRYSVYYLSTFHVDKNNCLRLPVGALSFQCFLALYHPSLPFKMPLVPFLYRLTLLYSFSPSCRVVPCPVYPMLCSASFLFPFLYSSLVSFPFVFPLFQREEKNKTQNKETKQAKENKGIEQKETSETSETKRNHWLDKRNTFPLLRTKN